MKVNVPFSFGVEGHSLPAGEYLVLTVTPERSIRITSIDGKHSAIVNTLPNYTKEPSTNSLSCSTSMATSTSCTRFGPSVRTWLVTRCRAGAQWRSPAAEASPKRRS